MSDTRETILARIRNTLQQDTRASSGIAAEPQLRQPVAGPQPVWEEDDTTRFINKLESVAGTIDRLSPEDNVVAVIAAYLQQHDIPPRLVSASSSLLDKLTWPGDFSVEHRKATGTDVTVLTEAYTAVAETGSLVLLSGASSPTSLNFLPDNFICILRWENLVRHIEDVWQRLRDENTGLPRAVNFITGPSRTADVEQTIQLGAHGPRRLHVILIE